MRVTSASLRVSSGEDGVNEDESSNDLSSESSSLAVTRGYGVSSASESVVRSLHESLHETHTTNGSKTLSYHVPNSSHKRDLTRQEQTESHSWVDVTT